MMKFRMKVFWHFVLLMLVMNLRTDAQNWQLIWFDEFDGSSLDLSKWEYQLGDGSNYGLPSGWGNNELQYYTNRPENLKIENGILTITVLEEVYQGFDYTSARIRTLNQGDWKYGKIEMRAKLPYGQGIWPAFWMLPTDLVYGGWAASGEIDIVEMVGHEANRVYGTLHYGGEWPNNVHTGTSYALTSGIFNDDFHIFSLEWEYGKIRWYLDGQLYQTQTNWYSTNGNYPAPFDQRFHLLLNLAVGGNWPGPPDQSTVFPQKFEIDYVRVYRDTTALPTIAITSPVDGENYPQQTSLKVSADVSSPSSPMEKVEFFQEDGKLGDTNSIPYEINLNNILSGKYTIRAEVTTLSGIKNYAHPIVFTVGDSSAHAPYLVSPLLVPGTIEAENYNKGGEGLAFHDSDPQINQGNQFGNDYRTTEGVDIEKTSDVGGGHNVGWLESGEWLNYFANIQQSGTYSVSVRVASQSGGGSFHIEIDGQNITGIINVPSTGGWQNWISISKDNIDLVEGIHVLKIVIQSGGFNINKILFSNITDIEYGSTDNIQSSFVLYQNFPNPFNPTTKILFKLSSASSVQLDIFNLQGQKIETVIDETLLAGTHNITFDGAGLASGIYIYRILAGDRSLLKKMLLIK